MCCGRQWDSARSRRSPFTGDHRGQHADHADRDRADRQDRPQAAAAGRIDRHGGHAGRRWRSSSPALRRRRSAAISTGRPGSSRWSPPTCSWSRSACRGGRWCGCCWARCSPTASGPRRSGLAAGVQWMANWLITVTFPALRARARPRLRLLRALRGAVVCFRLAMGPGDQGRVPGGHARRGVSGAPAPPAAT